MMVMLDHVSLTISASEKEILMDPHAYADTTIPSLVQHLKNEFVTYCAEKNMGPAEKQRASTFWEFCAEYLDNNRMVETWPADSNIGIKLSNNVRVLIHPVGKADAGQMQSTDSVGVTKGDSQPGHEGVTPSNAKRIV
jgi:hypothetical protein